MFGSFRTETSISLLLAAVDLFIDIESRLTKFVQVFAKIAV
jgi:hypothetical protein